MFGPDPIDLLDPSPYGPLAPPPLVMLVKFQRRYFALKSGV